MTPEQAVEAAAREVYCTSGRYRQMPYAVAVKACEAEALRILEAAAPFIRAQALNDAADELDGSGRWRYPARWLRARAVTERGGE